MQGGGLKTIYEISKFLSARISKIRFELWSGIHEGSDFEEIKSYQTAILTQGRGWISLLLRMQIF